MTAYNNPATPEEKAEALRNEQRLRKGEREPTSYHRLAGLADDLGGRWSVEAGQTKAVDYPRQDSASPWSGGGTDPGVEPSLGVEIDAQEPTGTFEEIERSLAEQGEPDADGMVPDQPSLGVDQQRSGSPPPSTKLTDEVDAPLASNSRAGVERPRRSIPIDQPDDGLDVPRRQDGWPLSSHAIKPRRKL